MRNKRYFRHIIYKKEYNLADAYHKSLKSNERKKIGKPQL